MLKLMINERVERGHRSVRVVTGSSGVNGLN